jgi:hypothetical protein
MFDGTPPAEPPAPDFQMLAQQYANLRLEDLNRMGGEIVALRIELATVRAERDRAVAALEAAAARIAELEKAS